MTDIPQVPEDLKPAFEQILKSAPSSFQQDVRFQQSILLYLKLGGARLARHYIEVSTKPFCEEFDLIRKRADGSSDGEEDIEDGGTVAEGDDETDD